MLRKPLVYYDKIYYYGPNNNQEKIQDLKHLMDKISQKIGYQILEFPEQIMETTEYPDDNRKIVIFDDLVNATESIQKKIANHYTDGRHHGIRPVYLSQSYYDVPSKLRINCSHMILYPPVTKNHLNLIAKENLVDPNLFNNLKPYEFLFLDKEQKSVTKNFDDPI